MRPFCFALKTIIHVKITIGGSMIKYTEENIKKLEEVYRIMMTASQLQNTAKRNQEILKAGELLGEVGLVSNADDMQQITAAYSDHILGRIREIVRNEAK